MRRFLLIFLGIVLTTLLSAQPASTFFSTFDAERGNALFPARDGNLWLGGMKDERVLLTKLSLSGKVLEKHSIDFQGNGLDTENLVEFFEDTDGTLVGCGNFENDNSGRAFVFRYNPATRTVLWAHIVRSGGLNYLSGIAPLGPGGDYVLYGNPQFAGASDAELLRIRRTTGQIVPDKAKRFGIGRADNLSQVVYHNGALYACGRFINSNTGFDGDFARSRNALCKIDTATLQPVWTRIGPIPSTTLAQIYGRDLIIDNGAIISTYSGAANDPDLFASTIFLQKNDLAGNLLWAKQYDLPEWNGEFAEEVIALPDGYLLYGQDLLSDTSRLFLLKTDQQGNPVAAVKVDYDENDEFSEIPARSKILRIGDALFFTALSQNNLGVTQGLLAKTDLNGWVNDSCGFFKKTTVNGAPMPAPVSEVVVPAVTVSPATLQSATTSVSLPDLGFSKKCGTTGTCPSLPDLRLTLDSLTCNDGDPILHYSFCNVGGQVYEGSAFFGLYNKNPLKDSAHLVTVTIYQSIKLLPGDCITGFVTSQLQPSALFEMFQLDTFHQFYALMGIHLNVPTPIALSSFPFMPNEPECNYLNNLDSLIVPSQVCSDCNKPSTFVKKLGNPTERELAFSMCRSADGNVYIAGRQGDDPMIAKITPLGEPIWVRNFAGNANFPVELAEIIEDSDRKLVLCGTEGGSPSNRHAVAMRYDPVADQVLWAQQYPVNRPVASGILEKSPGGNFLLNTNSQEIMGSALKTRSELLELDRATGAVLPALAVRYLGEPNLNITDMAMSNGNLYAVGGLQTGAQQSLLPMFAKISPADGQPQWAFLTDPDSTATGQKLIGPGSMVIDGDIVFIAGNEGAPDGNSLLYLEKRRTDGSLTWVRRYDTQIFPENVIRSENTIVVFGALSYNSWGMVKVDITTGDLIVAKTLDIALPSSNFTGFAYRKNRLLHAGLDLLMLDHTEDGTGGGDLLLLRTDTYFGMDDSCSLLRQTPIGVVTRPAKSRPALFQTVPTLTTAFAWPQVFKADALSVSKLCPRCACEGMLDITFKLNRIACAADSSLVFRAEVCNMGQAVWVGSVPVTFFDKNPLKEEAQAVWTVDVEISEPGLAPGGCTIVEWPLPGIAQQYPKLYALLGVSNSVSTPILLSAFPLEGPDECNYTNNLDSFVVKTPVCDGCENPTTFVKTMGRADQSEMGYSLCNASDGNVYMAGRQGNNPMIAKMTPNGEMLWVRNFPSFEFPFGYIDIVEIIEDSEGKLLLCGTRSHSPNTRQTVAMRYDPVADKVLWFKQYAELNPEALGIFEKTAGGNFVVYSFSDEQFGSGQFGTYYKSRSELWELNRATGEVVPALATLFPGNPSTSIYFQDMVPHNGSLYCVGGWSDQNLLQSGRAMLAKLSATDGTPEWIQGTLPDTVVQFQFFNWLNVLVDNDQLVVLGAALIDLNLPTQRSLVLLAKYDLDGTLLWSKSYDAVLGASDIVALPDGYAIFGATLGRAWSLLKVDKDGNLLRARKITAPATGDSYSFTRQNQLLRLPKHLLMLDFFKTGEYTDLALIKTDYDLNTDDSCGLFQPLQVVVEARASKTRPISAVFQPYAVTALNQQATFQMDSLNIRQLCPKCPCVDKPDLVYQVDSVYCSATDGVVAHIQVCNLGQVSPGKVFSVTFYDKNPLAGSAVPLYAAFVPGQPGFGDCIEYSLPLDAALQKYPKIYTLVGVWKDAPTPVSLADFPFPTGLAECDYANNLDSFDLNIAPPKPLQLGPDRALCTGQTAVLDAGSGYVAYQWLNGPATQTLTVGAAGMYIVEVTDVCGNQQRDTVQVIVSPSPKRTVNIVLLPGDSVTIAGKTYFGTTTLTDTIPSPTGVCDSVVTYVIRLDSLHCKTAASFLKVYETSTASTGRLLLWASDSSLYLAGDGANGTLLSKSDASGKLLWTRQIFDAKEATVSIYALIEDSEGMLVGCGNRLISGAGADRMFAFRYNPVANQVLWFKEITPPELGRATSILEKEAGGDYLLCQFHAVFGIQTSYASEIWRLDRATGTLVGGKVGRYESNVSITAAKMHQGALYATGHVKDASTPDNRRYGVMRIDPNTGAIVWVQKTIGSNVGDVGRDLLVDKDGNIVTLTGTSGTFWLQKTSPNGNLLWWRKYVIVSPLDGPHASAAIKLLKDGSYVVSSIANSLAPGGALRALAFIKIDSNGTVLWGKRVSEVIGTFGMSPQSLAVQGNDTYFTWGTTSASLMLSGTLFGKFDSNGGLGEGCSTVQDLTATFTTENATQTTVLLDFTNPVRTLLSPVISPPTSVKLLPYTRCSKCILPCEPVSVTKTIQFYPGDTITIDGVAYTESGTVVQNFTTPAGCDSVVTNILQRILTELSISCPTDLTVTLPPNEIKTVVDYVLPAATTNCPDPTISLRLLQGLPVGGSFSQGKTLVCYEAANECGIRDTCCFSITALPPDPACDVKTPSGCVRYELLGIRLDAQGQRRYRVRITNLCASPLEFAYIQLPNGVLAVSPVQGATYTAPGGNAYTVRNPNASPFYSIRYQAIVGSLNNGKSNIFEYTLPQQAQPAYIRASARLADGSYSETHLNTFYCPEVIENLEFRMESFSRSSSSAPFSILNSPLLVRPNPTSGVLFVDLVHWRFDSKSNLQSETPVHLRVLNAQGQLVLERDCVIEAEEMRLDLPAGLASGLYYLVAQPEGGERAAVRFVVER